MYDLLQVLIVERPRVQNPYKGMTDKIEKTYHKSYDTSEIVSKGSFIILYNCNSKLLYCVKLIPVHHGAILCILEKY